MRRGGTNAAECAASVPAPLSLGDAGASSIGSMSAMRCICRVMLHGDCLSPLPPSHAAAPVPAPTAPADDGGDVEEEEEDVECALTLRRALLSDKCGGSSAGEESSSVSLVGVGGNTPARLRRFAAEEGGAKPRERGRFAACPGEMEDDSAPPLRRD